MLIFVFKSSCDQEFCHIVIIYISDFVVWSVRQCIQFCLHVSFEVIKLMVHRLICTCIKFYRSFPETAAIVVCCPRTNAQDCICPGCVYRLFNLGLTVLVSQSPTIDNSVNVVSSDFAYSSFCTILACIPL